MLVSFFGKIVYTVLVVVEFVLGLRFIFKLIDAQEGNSVVSFVYKLTDPLVSLFHGIAPSPLKIGIFRIDVDSCLALVVCMLAGFVTVKVVRIFTPRRPEE
jgi:uncharacterized protein YggT (Ycf19 family)